MTTHNFTDAVQIGTFKDTSDGYMVAMSRIARTGVQEYRASELGMIGDHIIKVNRDEKEVFHKDTFASLARIPITVDHPQEAVTSDNWADLAVGEVGDAVLRDGDFIVVNPMVKDAKGVTAAKSTHKEFSAGYTAELVAVTDKDYDFEQTNIRYNHLALVPRGRAGSKARIVDADNWGASPVTTKEAPKMADTINVVIGDKVVQATATDAAIITKLIADHAEAMDAKDVELATANTALADATAKVLTDEQMAEKVKEFADKSMKLKAVTDKHGEEFVKGKSEAYIDAAFDLLPADNKGNKIADALGDVRKVADADPWAKFDNTKGVK